MVPGITYMFVKKYTEQCLKNVLRTNRYNIMYSIHAHRKQRPSYVDFDISGDVNRFPPNLKTAALA